MYVPRYLVPSMAKAPPAFSAVMYAHHISILHTLYQKDINSSSAPGILPWRWPLGKLDVLGLAARGLLSNRALFYQQ